MNPDSTNPLTGEELAEMERVAREATPGPWRKTVAEGAWAVRATFMVGNQRHTRWPAVCRMATGAEQDATHIATFDPPTVLALISAARSAVRAPEGWRLVPAVPTEAMVGAGRMAIPGGHGQAWLYVEAAYAGMIAAAPPPPGGEIEGSSPVESAAILKGSRPDAPCDLEGER